MTLHATGTFEIDLRPAEGELDGAAHRFDFTKTFAGDMIGRGTGVMLSGGDPGAGEAGFVAIEIFRGQVHGTEGTFLLQQFGQMTGGDELHHYEIVSGSGTGGLTGIAGRLDLTVDESGHRFTLDYTLP
jgi:hypothetical protein